MLILREVHYVFRHKECRSAFVVDHGVDMADLHVYLENWEVMPGGLFDSVDFLGNILEVCCIRYDERGEVGTWHTENDCPRRKSR